MLSISVASDCQVTLELGQVSTKSHLVYPKSCFIKVQTVPRHYVPKMAQHVQDHLLVQHDNHDHILELQEGLVPQEVLWVVWVLLGLDRCLETTPGRTHTHPWTLLGRHPVGLRRSRRTTWGE